MIFIVSVCIKWSSDHDSIDLFQDAFVLGIINKLLQKYKCGHGQRTWWTAQNFERLLRHI